VANPHVLAECGSCCIEAMLVERKKSCAFGRASPSVVVADAGNTRTYMGELMATIRLDSKPEWEADALCRALAGTDRVAAARVMVTDAVQTSIQTREKSMRSKDGTFAALLVIEGFDETSVRNALRRLPSLAPQLNCRLIEELPLYALCFTLDRRLLPG